MSDNKIDRIVKALPKAERKLALDTLTKQLWRVRIELKSNKTGARVGPVRFTTASRARPAEKVVEWARKKFGSRIPGVTTEVTVS